MARWRAFKNKAVRCYYCWLSVDELVDRGIYMTVDHVVARSRGGTNDGGNLVTACDRCNNMKADTDGWYEGCVALEGFGNPQWFRDMLLSEQQNRTEERGKSGKGKRLVRAKEEATEPVEYLGEPEQYW